MKNRIVCGALLALTLGGCTMNGKKMFELGSPTPSASAGETPVANEADYVTPSGVYDGIPTGSNAEASAIEMDRRAIHRTEFDGDKMLSDTRKEYKLDPGIDGFR